MGTRFSSLLLPFVLAGCVTHLNLTEDAVSYNLAVEEAQNQALLLNVLRAKNRHPMVFTDITRITGSLTGTAGAALALPFGGAAADNYAAAPSANVSGTRSFDVGVLGSEKFMRGILKPIDMKVFQYYLRQGWPPDMLLYLFVRRIDTGGKVLENEPGNPAKFLAFRTFAERLLETGFDVLPASDLPQLLGPGSRADALDRAQIIQAKAAGLEWVEANGLLYLGGSAPALVLKARKSSHSEAITDNVVELLQDSRTAEELLEQESRNPRLRELQASLEYVRAPKLEFDDLMPAADGSKGNIYLRSPEGILYYLGEIARAVNEHARPTAEGGSVVKSEDEARGMKVQDFVPWLRSFRGQQGSPLFIVYSSELFDGPTQLSVSYAGEEFVIPADPRLAGKSMHCLTLIEQLLALQKSAEELPQSLPVRIVGS